MLNIGDKFPYEIILEDQHGAPADLKQFQGKRIVLFFYPKDNTSGCTKEACAFRDLKADFEAKSAHIFGVSKDSAKSHLKFIENHQLNFPLLVDSETKLAQAVGSWVEKSMYGRKYMGMDRSTFIVDETGHVSHIWRKVKVPGHVETVLDAL